MEYQFKCSKCGFPEYEKGLIGVKDELTGKMLGAPRERFTVISCKKCGFSEFYHQEYKVRATGPCWKDG